MALDLNKPLLMSGTLYVGLVTAGVRQPLLPAFEVDQFSVTPSAETVEQKSKAVATYGVVRSSIILPGDTEIALAPMDLPAEVMAMIMMGNAAVLTQTASSVTDADYTGVLDRWIDLAHRQLSSVVVNLDGAGALMVEGTDYEIDYVAGMLKAISAQCAAAIEVDYSHAAIAGKSVSISDASNVTRWARLVGKNLHDDEPVIFDAYRVKLRPTSAMDLMANQHVVGGLSGKMEQSTDPLDSSAVGHIHYLGT